MGNCSNCYDGCTQTTTDKCVKYTGIDYPILGIKKGDSLSYIEQAIITFLADAIQGTGVKFDVSRASMCELVSENLEDCKDLSVVDYVKALIKVACILDERVSDIELDLENLESNYDVGCVDGAGIDGSEGTHTVLQATIVKLCQVDSGLGALALDLQTNYVKITDVGTYIENYLVENSGNSSGEQTKMVPFTAVEYYGPLNYFDATGAGTGDWINIYLCNGNNNTPDKRGRTPVGTTSGMGGGAFSSTVDPAVPGNPSYSLRDGGGQNSVTLMIGQIPSHTHTGVTEEEGLHTHTVADVITRQNSDGDALSRDATISGGANTVTSSSDGSHSHAFTTAARGGNEDHPNIQPVLACHYIIYMPI